VLLFVKEIVLASEEKPGRDSKSCAKVCNVIFPSLILPSAFDHSDSLIMNFCKSISTFSNILLFHNPSIFNSNLTFFFPDLIIETLLRIMRMVTYHIISFLTFRLFDLVSLLLLYFILFMWINMFDRLHVPFNLLYFILGYISVWLAYYCSVFEVKGRAI